MKKLYYFMFLIMLSFIFIPNTYALTCDINKPVINVESLPTASVDTLNNTYYYNGKFYSTTSTAIPSYIKLNDDLKDKYLYFDYVGLANYLKNDVRYYDTKIFNNNYMFHLFNNSTLFIFNYSLFGTTENGSLTIDKSNGVIVSNPSNIDFHNFKISYSFIITDVSNYEIIKDYFFYKDSQNNYSYTTCDSSSVEMQKGKEIYLFFSSYDMKNLSIFENVDFSTFTSFQIILLTFGINFLFISILLFFFYIGYKLIFKLWSIVKCLL